MGVEQVIHGNEIEASAELLPEQPFRHSHQERAKTDDEEPEQGRGTVGAGARDDSGRKCQPEEIRRQRINRGDKIKAQADAETAEKISGGKEKQIPPGVRP